MYIGINYRENRNLNPSKCSVIISVLLENILVIHSKLNLFAYLLINLTILHVETSSALLIFWE